MDGTHHLGVRELDLSNWHMNAVADRLNHAVPAIKSSTGMPAAFLLGHLISASCSGPSQGSCRQISSNTAPAFLSFLRANLVLDSASISHNNTPVIQPARRQVRSRPVPQPIDSFPEDLDDIPELSLEILSDPEEKKRALALVADSITEQRHDTALSLVLHPFSLTALVAFLAMVHHRTRALCEDSRPPLLMIIVTTFVATYFTIIHRLTDPYARLASSTSHTFLQPDASLSRPSSSHSTSSTMSDGRSDLILAARSASGDLASVVVLRLEPKQPCLAGLPPAGPPSGTKKRSKGSSGNAGPLRGGKGIVRAWTTARAWRHRGIGTDLLREAARVTKERCGKDAEVGFAKEHANSKMVLPETFNRAFRRKERKAAFTLDRVAGEWELGRKRR